MAHMMNGHHGGGLSVCQTSQLASKVHPLEENKYLKITPIAINVLDP